MKPSDIRIGNYLKVSLTGEIIEVDSIMSNGRVNAFISEDGNEGYWLNELEGVELTEEMLWRAGMVDGTFKGGAAVYKIKIMSHPEALGDPAISVLDPFDNTQETVIAWDIKTLHQLQNVFAILTGEELNIEL